MAKIIDFDQVKAGASSEGEITPGSDSVGKDAPCGIDFISCNANDGACTIDFGSCIADGVCLIADYACGNQSAT